MAEKRSVFPWLKKTPDKRPGVIDHGGSLSPYSGRSPPDGAKPGRLWILLPEGQPDGATWLDEEGLRWPGAPPRAGVPEGWRPPWVGPDPMLELERVLRDLERRYADTYGDE